MGSWQPPPPPPLAAILSLRGWVAKRESLTGVEGKGAGGGGGGMQEHSTAQHSQHLFSAQLTSTKSPVWGADRRGIPRPTPPLQPPTTNMPARAVRHERRRETGVGG